MDVNKRSIALWSRWPDFLGGPHPAIEFAREPGGHMLVQLNPPIPLDTPKGKGYAYFLLDYSQDHDLCWVTFLDDSGECWTFRNPEIRIQSNITLGRRGQAARPHDARVAAMPFPKFNSDVVQVQK